jgi:predicted lipoprotein with Yx(FWY)xxD motif
MKRVTTVCAALVLVVAACGGSDATDTTSAPEETTASTTATTAVAETTTTEAPGPATSPAEVVFEDQESDGTQIVVASVTLPSPGFIAVHGNDGGAPGPVVGHSDLLPAGTSTDVTVTLDTPLESTDLLFPMAHIDVNENGEYEFMPPDEVTDGPASTADGEVAVVGAEVTVSGSNAMSSSIEVASTDLGEMLVDADGNSLYLFIPDAQGDSTCYDDCEANWPPLTDGAEAGAEVDAALIGSTTRTDGSEQVTYNGWPLYYFAGDAAPGDTNGQGLNDVWFLVSPSGEPIR